MADEQEWQHDHPACGSKAKHGTDAGWQHHRKVSEEACPACRTAHNTRGRGGRQRDRLADAEADRAQLERVNAALTEFVQQFATADCLRPDLGARCECSSCQARRILAVAAAGVP